MSKYPDSRKRGLKTVPALLEGELATAVRVRGPADLVQWAASLTPLERGLIFAAARAGSAPSASADPLPEAQASRLARWKR
jgi:hypothetical protein